MSDNIKKAFTYSEGYYQAKKANKYPIASDVIILKINI